MENTNSSSTTTEPTLCTAGCGFYGNEAFNNMCSQCFKALNKSDGNIANTDVASQITKAKIASPPSNDAIPLAEKLRKHLRSPSPDGPRVISAPTSSIPTTSSATDSVATTSAATPTTLSDKPVQSNKGRCFKCRIKVPLAKQAANKCRCSYIFCDNHRYPDRHDCDIDYAKMDREILAKNNPKLHTRRRYQEI